MLYNGAGLGETLSNLDAFDICQLHTSVGRIVMRSDEAQASEEVMSNSSPCQRQVQSADDRR